MDNWEMRVLLEDIIYKMFRKIDLNSLEKEKVTEIAEMRDYGRILE